MSQSPVIRSADYQHPNDISMLSELNRMKNLRERAARFLKEVDEPMISGSLTANGIKVSNIQFPEVHQCVMELAGKFGIKTPQVFIINEPRPNAFTHGISGQTFVGLTHSLVEQLDGDGLKCIIGHEIGHIQCRHVLYITMIHWMMNSRQQQQGDANNMLLNMLAWMRMAELSADRAGLIACENEQAACRAMLTLLVGSRSLAERVDINEYVADQTVSLTFNPLAIHHQHIESHPFMPFRISELQKFACGQTYKQLAGQHEPIIIDLN